MTPPAARPYACARRTDGRHPAVHRAGCPALTSAAEVESLTRNRAIALIQAGGSVCGRCRPSMVSMQAGDPPPDSQLYGLGPRCPWRDVPTLDGGAMVCTVIVQGGEQGVVDHVRVVHAGRLP